MSKPKHVLMIFCDQMRYDAMGQNRSTEGNGMDYGFLYRLSHRHRT